MHLFDYSSEDIFNDEYLAIYEEELDAIWWEIIQLNTLILLLKRLTQFPFELFLLKKPLQNFWDLVIGSFFDECVMIIWRIVSDENPKTITIRKVQKNVSKNLKNDTLRSEFDISLNSVNFDNSIESVEKNIQIIRHNYLAHFNRTRNIESNKENSNEVKIKLLDLEKVNDQVNSLFELLCFDFIKSTLHLGYIDPDKENDLDNILNTLVKDSIVLNMPEKESGLWKYHKENLTESEIDVINTFREKFGLPKT